MPFFHRPSSLIEKSKLKSRRYRKQYKAIRDVLASQGYVAAGLSIGICCVYDLGADGVQDAACLALLTILPSGVGVIAGKAAMKIGKVGNAYRVGHLIYNTSMLPLKGIHFIMQSPFFILDMLVLHEIYVPKLDAKWWNIGNYTDDLETVSDTVLPLK